MAVLAVPHESGKSRTTCSSKAGRLTACLFQPRGIGFGADRNSRKIVKDLARAIWYSGVLAVWIGNPLIGFDSRRICGSDAAKRSVHARSSPK